MTQGMLPAFLLPNRTFQKRLSSSDAKTPLNSARFRHRVFSSIVSPRRHLSESFSTFENPAQTSRCSLPLGCLNRFTIGTKTQQPPCNYPADSCFHYSSANICMSEYQSGTALVHQHRNVWPDDDEAAYQSWCT